MSVVEACQKCGIYHISNIKWMKAGATVERQLDEKRVKKSIHGDNVFSLLIPIIVQLLCFFSTINRAC